MAGNTSRPEGFNKFNNLQADVADLGAGIVDSVDYDRYQVNFRGIKAGAGIAINIVDADGFSGTPGNTIEISATGTGGGGSGEANTLANLGTGQSVIASPAKTGAALNLKSIKAGPNISVTTTGNDIIIEGTAPAGPAGRGVTSASINGSNQLVMTYSDSTSQTLGVVVGPQGPQGPIGPTGAQGATGATGPQGDTGPAGATGATGAQGPQGPQGATGPAGADSTVPGPQGPAGKSITAGTVLGNGHLELTFSDSTTADVGVVVGPQGPAGATGAQGATGATGPAGRSISSGQVLGNGHLELTFSDSTTADVGIVVGPQGPAGPTGNTGATGATGPAGKSIASGAVDGSGHLILTFSDSTTTDVGIVVGPQGPQGATGATGATGAQGPQGATGATGPQGPASNASIQDEGVALGSVGTINFTGAGVTASYDAGTSTATVNIPGGGASTGMTAFRFKVKLGSSNLDSTTPIDTSTVPAGWTVVLSGTSDVSVTHNTGKMPIMVSYLGKVSAVSTDYQSRAAISAASAFRVNPDAPSTFLITSVTTTTTGGASNTEAWVYVYFA